MKNKIIIIKKKKKQEENMSMSTFSFQNWANALTLLHSERPKLYGVLAILSAIGLNMKMWLLNFHYHGVLAILSAIGLNMKMWLLNFHYYGVLAILSAIGLNMKMWLLNFHYRIYPIYSDGLK